GVHLSFGRRSDPPHFFACQPIGSATENHVPHNHSPITTIKLRTLTCLGKYLHEHSGRSGRSLVLQIGNRSPGVGQMIDLSGAHDPAATFLPTPRRENSWLSPNR